MQSVSKAADEEVTAFTTHDVVNQAPTYAGYNLAGTDPVLMAAAGDLDEAARASLVAHGAKCGSEAVLELGRLANRHKPILKTHDIHGRRFDQVEFHPAYHDLMADAFSEGLHSALLDAGLETQMSRAAKFFLTSQAETGHTCPITMTNAAAAVLAKYPDVTADFLPKMQTRTYDARFLPAADKNGITVGMGMTEKQGGTDLRAISSTAEAGNQGFYAITGHKWFFSAPMCDAFLVLAKTQAGPSCFLVPRVLPDGRVNGLRFQRLKDKLGNHANASSEVEFHRAEGLLLGDEGRGIATIIDMVTPTRIDCALGSAGQMRAALARAVHHCRHRRAFGATLIDQPLMVSVLADMALDVAAATALSMRLARASALAWTTSKEAAYARLMTPAIKYWICKTGPALTYEAMECLGGNGYVEDFDMARIYRDAPVNPIWEGSGNVMALDVLRALAREPESLDLVLNDLAAVGMEPVSDACLRIRDLAQKAAHDQGTARTLTELLALSAAAVALAKVAPDPEIAEAFAASRLSGGWRATYGQLPGGFDGRAAIEALCPAS
ncbi:DNA alkylation response protein [Roseibium sp. RKSG952]|nr:acyl-CoA dehydrogenase family protein [Roseibium sp. RKSG952]MTH97697.1 DNA alkylation response protein [Roseibium sp. RKSG952]